jgi:hypothetical protein
MSFVLVPIWAVRAPGMAFAQCPASPDATALTRKYSGEYENFAYGFRVSIPDPFIGRDGDNPLYQRGFPLLFPDSQESIAVYVDINSLEWRSVTETATGYAKAFAGQAAKMVSEYRKHTLLGHRDAIQDTADYLCGGGETLFSSITIVSLSRDKRFVYTLRWEGKKDERAAGNEVLQKLVSSWRFFAPRS